MTESSLRSIRFAPILLFFAISSSIPLFAADQWMVRRETSSGTCHVQIKTASPLGADLAGPFNSRKDACQKAKDLYDSDATDPNKCSGYGQGAIDGCKKDGVLLPGETKTSQTERSAADLSTETL